MQGWNKQPLVWTLTLPPTSCVTLDNHLTSLTFSICKIMPLLSYAPHNLILCSCTVPRTVPDIFRYLGKKTPHNSPNGMYIDGDIWHKVWCTQQIRKVGCAVHKHLTVRTTRPMPSATLWSEPVSAEPQLAFRQLGGLSLLKLSEKWFSTKINSIGTSLVPSS